MCVSPLLTRRHHGQLRSGIVKRVGLVPSFAELGDGFGSNPDSEGGVLNDGSQSVAD